MKGYRTAEVAEVLGVSASQVRSWTRSGFIEPQRTPGGAYRFSFQDIVLLRTARALVEQSTTPRKVRAALVRLRAQLPTGRPLSSVHIAAVGERLLVRDEGATWDPESGQLHFELSVSKIAAKAEPMAPRALEDLASSSSPTADDWFNAAVDLEAVAVEQAKEAYARSLERDPGHAEAHLNLGRLLHEEGHVREAEAHYREAAVADPASAPAFFNLGVALEDRRIRTGAVEAYEAALRLDPELAEAHFNLSRLLEHDGREAEAIRHMADYRRLRRLPT